MKDDDDRFPFPDPSILNRPIVTSGRKSHARKRSEGHIPRARNAFILFRCCLVSQGKVPEDLKDHSRISKHAGDLWQKLPAASRAKWHALARLEKDNHSKVHRLDKTKPSNGPTRRKARNVKQATPEHPSPLVLPTLPTITPTPSHLSPFASVRRRSSSCPPPGAHPLDPESTPFTFKDDSVDQNGRRLSRVGMYQTTPAPPPTTAFNFPTTYIPPFPYNTAPQNYSSWEGSAVSYFYTTPMPNVYYTSYGGHDMPLQGYHQQQWDNMNSWDTPASPEGAYGYDGTLDSPVRFLFLFILFSTMED